MAAATLRDLHTTSREPDGLVASDMSMPAVQSLQVIDLIHDQMQRCATPREARAAMRAHRDALADGEGSARQDGETRQWGASGLTSVLTARAPWGRFARAQRIPAPARAQRLDAPL